MRHLLPVLLAPACAALPAHAQADIEQLQQQLRQRDALIQDLLRRVEALEQKSRDRPPATPAAPTPPATTSALVQPPPSPAGAGQDDDMQRALERALVRQGGLVLPPRAVEVEPRYQFTHDGNRGLGIVQTAAGPQVAQGSAARQRHELSLGLRVGLPAASQLALRLPYAMVRNRTSAAAAGLDQVDRASGWGDVEVEFTRQFSDERGARPALLGSVTWKPATGEFHPGLPSPGSGHASVQAALTAVKRQDPLVFVGSLSYTAASAYDDAAGRTQPGAGVGLRVATLLAASPQSSLRLGLELARIARSRVNGGAVPGTETFSGLIELGLSSVLSRTTSLDASVGFGVTPDAPRLRLGLSVPIRFR